MKNNKTDSPNAFIPKPQVARMSKKPLLIGGAFLFVLLLVFLWGFFKDSTPKDEQEVEFVENKNDKPLVQGENLQGLALPTAPEGVVSSSEYLPGQNATQPIIVVTGPKEDETLKREQEQLRRYRLQAQIGALGSPLLAKRVGGTKQERDSYGNTSSQNARASGQNDERYKETSYDAEADKDKEAFFGRADAMDSDWISPNVRTTGQKFEVKTGSVIPSVMVTGVNSDLPGAMIGQVSQNVYDTATGRHLLIPQGTKVYGVYDSRVVYGQERVLIAWNRLIYPDGSAMTLGAMPGADQAGYAGFTDEIDNHYMRIFGSAFMMSLITGGMAYTMDSLGSGGNDDDVSIQGEMTSALAAQLGQTTTTMLQKNLNIKPTLEIRPGYQYNVVVTKDIIFDAPYSAKVGQNPAREMGTKQP